MPAPLDPEKDQFFRANVGIIVVDEERRVLALSRADVPGSWQLPQGGLQTDDRDLEHAALRELREETGIQKDQVELVAEHPCWLAYELPEPLRSAKTGRGQVQKWLLFRCKGGARIDVDLATASDREFDDSKWIPFAALVDEVVAFRKPVYKQLAGDFSQFLQ